MKVDLPVVHRILHRILYCDGYIQVLFISSVCLYLDAARPNRSIYCGSYI